MMPTSQAKKRAFAALRWMAYHTPLQSRFFHSFDYMFTPRQLAFLTRAIEDLEPVPGGIAEIGCAFAATTVFLCKTLDELDSTKLYYAIDTFGGFTDADIKAERELRGGAAVSLSAFRQNDVKWFERTLANNDVDRVVVRQADCMRVDYKALGPLSFALLDVDLYRPIQGVLPKLYDALSPGGMIVVDDCKEGVYQGALQAYDEFVAERGLARDIRLGKLGLVCKPL